MGSRNFPCFQPIPLFVFPLTPCSRVMKNGSCAAGSVTNLGIHHLGLTLRLSQAHWEETSVSHNVLSCSRDSRSFVKLPVRSLSRPWNSGQLLRQPCQKGVVIKAVGLVGVCMYVCGREAAAPHTYAQPQTDSHKCLVRLLFPEKWRQCRRLFTWILQWF